MRPAGKHLLTFAVIADTHANQGEEVSSSPYPCNRLANARARYVIAEVNRLKPRFVVHLGDIVNPVPELPTYDDAAGHFKALAEELEAPLHLVAGNHDVGDKPVSWSPAGTVSDANLKLYERHFGRHFYAFDVEDLHLVVINTPVINSGLPVEAEQAAWLAADLAANQDRRTFLFTHYPPYLSDPAEASCYDNLDEPGRSWFLGLIERHRPEALFCGHVHNFWYDLYAKTEMYLLPSTAFVRHDYSEFYRVAPGDQFGRNDEAKLGYFLVKVYETGHVAENLRTYGRTLAPGARLGAPDAQAVHSKESALLTLGVDMRHPWAEEMEIAPSGALDEFERKIARNDYPLLALWEMGLRLMRVPVQDLLNPRVRRRMALLKEAGHRFQTYCYGLPGKAALEGLTQNSDLIERLELVVDWDRMTELPPAITALKESTGLSILLSRVNRKDAGKHQGKRYNHLISHGFTFDERDELAALQERAPGLFASVLVSVPRKQAPWEAAGRAAEMAEALKAKVCLYLKSTEASPAAAFLDDAANAQRVAEALLASVAHDGVDIILDNFTDSDRGYFVRSGLVDRRYNPRLAGRVVSHLQGLLNLRERSWKAVPLEQPGVAAALRSDAATLYLLEEEADAAEVARRLDVRAEIIRLGGEGPRCLWVLDEAERSHPPRDPVAATA